MLANGGFRPYGIPVLFHICTDLGALVVSVALMSASMIATIQAKEITGMTSTPAQGNGYKNGVAQLVEIIIQIFDVWMVLEARGIGVEPTANMLNSRPCYLCEMVVEAVDKLLLVNTEPSG